MFDAPDWQISTGDIFELLRPAAFALAVLLSACILADTRRRRFKLYAVALWTLATLLAPYLALPLYLITYIFPHLTHQTPPPPPDEAKHDDAHAETLHRDDAHAATLQHDDAPAATLHDEDAHAATLRDDAANGDMPAQPSSQTPSTPHARPRPRTLRALRSALAATLRALLLPALYALALLACAALYFLHDSQSLDAHLARAANARLRNLPQRAIDEYRAALRLQDDPHTRKLLGVELSETHRDAEALAECLAAERGGEPDAALAYRIAATLDALKRAREADDYYRKFLQGSACTQAPPDARCESARARLRQASL